MSGIGKRIKALREELNLTQEQLAKRLGYKSKSTINKIEMGINDITQSKIVAIADALQTTPAYLMGWEEISPSDESDLIIMAGDGEFKELNKLPETAQKQIRDLYDFMKKEFLKDDESKGG